uniref:Uncharacterized protein n=1 Tax=Knipowitschia caucasica TaxID=637954 RepID=A0AAV2MHH7_KNICA
MISVITNDGFSCRSHTGKRLTASTTAAASTPEYPPTHGIREEESLSLAARVWTRRDPRRCCVTLWLRDSADVLDRRVVKCDYHVKTCPALPLSPASFCSRSPSVLSLLTILPQISSGPSEPAPEALPMSPSLQQRLERLLLQDNCV